MQLYDPAVFASIQEKLSEMEETEHIRILHCVESGSRAWGFASPDSDYDVRFIYVREPAFYLRLEKTKDTIEWELNDVYDISGWDLQKALRLLYKSNPTLFEWNSSPIIYRSCQEWEQLKPVLAACFQPHKGIYHYLSTARSNYHAYLRGDTVKLKKYFYALRPLLACRWIMERNCPPPMLFSELADAQLDASIKPVVDDLLLRKMQTPESGAEMRIDALNAYLLQQMQTISEYLHTISHQQHADWEPLNAAFRQILGS